MMEAVGIKPSDDVRTFIERERAGISNALKPITTYGGEVYISNINKAS